MDNRRPKINAWSLFTLPLGIGLKQVLDISLSKSASYHMLSVPAAPAPIATNKIPIIASFTERTIGEDNKPTAQVKITNDITLGFISFISSLKTFMSETLCFLALILVVDIFKLYMRKKI